MSSRTNAKMQAEAREEQSPLIPDTKTNRNLSRAVIASRKHPPGSYGSPSAVRPLLTTRPSSTLLEKRMFGGNVGRGSHR